MVHGNKKKKKEGERENCIKNGKKCLGLWSTNSKGGGGNDRNALDVPLCFFHVQSSPCWSCTSACLGLVRYMLPLNRISCLNHNFYLLRCIHGDIFQSERNDIISAFKKQEFPVLVATDVAARGLDIPHIRTVVNFDVARYAFSSHQVIISFSWKNYLVNFGFAMVLYGYSEIGVQVSSNFCYLICLRHSNRSRATTNRIFCSTILYFTLVGSRN